MPKTATQFMDLYRRVLPRIKRYLSRRNCPLYLIDDIAQDVALIAWRQRESFRDEAPFTAYLFGVARNLLRRAQRHPSVRYTEWSDSEQLAEKAPDSHGHALHPVPAVKFSHQIQTVRVRQTNAAQHQVKSVLFAFRSCSRPIRCNLGCMSIEA
jgi:RNA polymerase sigma factor (sigma-70 family)